MSKTIFYVLSTCMLLAACTAKEQGKSENNKPVAEEAKQDETLVYEAIKETENSQKAENTVPLTESNDRQYIAPKQEKWTTQTPKKEEFVEPSPSVTMAVMPIKEEEKFTETVEPIVKSNTLGTSMASTTLLDMFFASDRGYLETTFSINPLKDTLLTCKQGTVFRIAANSFVQSNGKEPNGQVSLKVQEFYKRSDMVLNNMSTSSGGELLESGGMLYIEAKDAKETKLEPNPAKPIEVFMPVDNTSTEAKNDMQLFYADRKTESQALDWKAEGSVKLDKMPEPQKNTKEEFLIPNFEILSEVYTVFTPDGKTLRSFTKTHTPVAKVKFEYRNNLYNYGYDANKGIIHTHYDVIQNLAVQTRYNVKLIEEVLSTEIDTFTYDLIYETHKSKWGKEDPIIRRKPTYWLAATDPNIRISKKGSKEYIGIFRLHDCFQTDSIDIYPSYTPVTNNNLNYSRQYPFLGIPLTYDESTLQVIKNYCKPMLSSVSSLEEAYKHIHEKRAKGWQYQGLPIKVQLIVKTRLVKGVETNRVILRSANSNNAYYIKLSKFGFINCDRFPNDEKTIIAIEWPKSTYNIEFAIYKKLQCVQDLYFTNNVVSVNRAFTVLVLKEENGQLWYATQDRQPKQNTLSISQEAFLPLPSKEELGRIIDSM